MTCSSIQPLLPLYVEDDLPSRKTARVRQHVEGCLACRRLTDQYRQSQHWLRAAATPTIPGAELEELRRAVWRRLETAPRPAPLWLVLERGWAALRRWASQPVVAVAAVGLVVVGSVGMTRVGGLGGSRLGAQLAEPELSLEPPGDDNGADDREDAELLLASATPEELAEGSETGEAEPSDESVADKMRIEIQTQDPNVRIIWFTPPAAEPAPVGN
jgi:hypothetical protein